MGNPFRILMIVGWKVKRGENIPPDLQPPDYYCEGRLYWFFRHLPEKNIEVDVVDNSCPLRVWGLFEKKVIHFYIWQALKKLQALTKYDLIISHGAQSAFFLAFVRSLIGAKFPPHIIIDIGSLNGGRRKRSELTLCRLALKSVAGLIYHVKMQEVHYEKYFPEIVKKCRFIPFGADKELFIATRSDTKEDYILSIGYAKRDWATLISSYEGLRGSKPSLRILGSLKPIPGVLPKGVTAIGKVSFRDMITQISRTHFVVIPLPHLPYAIGQMTVLQSMAMGKAVIVSRVPSLVDYITDSHDGFFYSPSDTNDLREKMQFLIENPAISKFIGANARMTIESRFNEAVMAKGIWNAVMDLINTDV